MAALGVGFADAARQLRLVRRGAAHSAPFVYTGVQLISKNLLRDAPDLVAQERAIYASRLAELQAQTAVGQSQLAQRQQELRETQSQRETAERGIELLQKELARTRPLRASGAVSATNASKQWP